MFKTLAISALSFTVGFAVSFWMLWEPAPTPESAEQPAAELTQPAPTPELTTESVEQPAAEQAPEPAEQPAPAPELSIRTPQRRAAPAPAEKNPPRLNRLTRQNALTSSPVLLFSNSISPHYDLSGECMCSHHHDTPTPVYTPDLSPQ